MQEKMTANEIRNMVGSGLDPERVTCKALREAGQLMYVLSLPENFPDRMRMLGNVMAEMCRNHKLGNERIRLELRELSAALSYLLNSTSFREDQYYEFDEAEVGRKLRRS